MSLQNIDGKDVYVVEFALPQGEKSIEYYDKASGLKVQTLQVLQAPQGEVSVTVRYSDYKTVDGILFPHTLTQSQGPMVMKFETTSVQINVEVDETAFKVE
jgi:zinc protease